MWSLSAPPLNVLCIYYYRDTVQTSGQVANVSTLSSDTPSASAPLANTYLDTFHRCVDKPAFSRARLSVVADAPTFEDTYQFWQGRISRLWQQLAGIAMLSEWTLFAGNVEPSVVRADLSDSTNPIEETSSIQTPSVKALFAQKRKQRHSQIIDRLPPEPLPFLLQQALLDYAVILIDLDLWGTAEVKNFLHAVDQSVRSRIVVCGSNEIELAQILSEGIADVLPMAQSNRLSWQRLLRRQIAMLDGLKQQQLYAQRAEEAADARDRFLTNMSHDLRTPMNAIIGFGYRLQKHYSHLLDERGYSALEAIGRNAHKLQNMISQLLELSKVENGLIDVTPREVNVSAMVPDICDEFAETIRKKDLCLQVHLPEQPVCWQTDLMLFDQVMTNLLSNAVTYTQEGLITVDVAVEHQAGDDQLVLSVADTGIGIDKVYHEKLFEEFGRYHGLPLDVVDSCGVGLVVAASYVKLLGGDIKVDSELGKGSCFTVRLKALAEPTTEVA